MISGSQTSTLVPWCSGLTCGPVKAEIGGSNPLEPATSPLFLPSAEGAMRRSAEGLIPAAILAAVLSACAPAARPASDAGSAQARAGSQVAQRTVTLVQRAEP